VTSTQTCANVGRQAGFNIHLSGGQVKCLPYCYHSMQETWYV